MVFHPSYTYENFVMGLLPDVADGAVTVTPHVGPLLELAQFASEATENKALLILDEFNRGNAAAIFGDMLGLIDGDKRDVASIDTPYAHLGPKTGLGPLGRTITLPEDLRIIAAMNSADRSVAPLDAALRRRFSIIHVDPDIDLLRNHLNASVDEDFQVNDPDTWTTAGHVAAVAVELLESLNRRIMFVLGRDFLLGQSVFWNLAVTADVDAALESLAAALDNQVLGTLALSFTDDDEGLAAVLGVTEAKNAPAAAYWKAPPTDLMRWPNRLELRRFQEFELSELKQAIVRLLEPVPEFEDDPTGADVTTTADSPEPPEEM